MKKLFKNYYNLIKDNFKTETNIMLVEGILLSICAVLTLLFNRTPGTLLILYLFPISLIIIAVLCLFYAKSVKKLPMRFFIYPQVEAFAYLLILIVYIFSEINPYKFIKIIGLFIIIKDFYKYFKYEKPCKLNIIDTVLVVVIGLVSIIFNKQIVDSYFIYLVVVYLLLGIKKISYYMIFKKLRKN